MKLWLMAFAITILYVCSHNLFAQEKYTFNQNVNINTTNQSSLHKNSYHKLTSKNSTQPLVIAKLYQKRRLAGKRYKKRLNPASNVMGDTSYLRNLLDKYKGNIKLALATYNASRSAIKRHGNKVPPYKETRRY
jgi:hypothetical protein